MVPSELLQQAEAVVLLASFGSFVPKGAAGRPLQQALRLMDERLGAGDLLDLFADFRPRPRTPFSNGDPIVCHQDRRNSLDLEQPGGQR